jgi:hypothetical protein
MSRNTSILSRYDPRTAVASLVAGDQDGTPRDYQQSDDRRKRGWSKLFSGRDVEIERPQNETSEYYRLYETNPFVGTPIDDVASEVWEPGWYVEADDATTASELTEFGEKIGYVGNRPKRNLSKVGYQGVVQYLARGDWVCEKLVNDDGKPVGLNPLQKETFEIYTDPDTNVVVQPSDTHLDHVKLTPKETAAAYVQFDNSSEFNWQTKSERRFARDEILHWANNPDVGDVWGTSVVERVYDRALALEAKLRDNDDAVAMKAWPMVLFQTGTAENPWTQDEIDSFMESYDGENFGPGMYQAVPGDIEVEEFAGETADIEETVSTDVNIILSGMPAPKYVLGTFENELAPSIASAQERKYRKYVRQLRREQEQLMTRYFRDVAEAWGLDTEGIELHIERRAGDVLPEDVSGNIIRYTSDVDAKGQAAADERDDPGGVNDGDGDAPVDPGGTRSDVVPDLTDLASLDGPVDDPLETIEPGTAELADARLVGTRDLEQELRESISTIYADTLDVLLERARQRREPADGSQLQEIAMQSLAGAADRAGLQMTSSAMFGSVLDRVDDTLQQPNHVPQMRLDRQRSTRLRREAYRSLRADMDSVATDMARAVRRVQSGSRLTEAGADIVRDTFTEGMLASQASVQARMRAQSLINEAKLAEYEADDRVVGVQIINPCTANTTLLCKQIASCGDRGPVMASFNASEPVMAQLARQVDETPPDGFRPMGLPPFHYGCRSELAPVVEEMTES